ncbi:MAG: 3-deoxy-7-phosphoheptulonate synthase [Clostridia bacterium]
MIIIMKPTATEHEIQDVERLLYEKKMTVQRNNGVHCTVLGVLGDVTSLEPASFTLRPGVERVMSVSEPYKKASRTFHQDDTIVRVGNVEVGAGRLTLIAGPCSVENAEQMDVVARAVCAAGACMLRGGAFKPRTSPYAFQGLEEEGIRFLRQARADTGLPIVSELMSERHIDLFEREVDVIQIGARNMQNFDLLKAVGETHKPILLKRGLSATVEEWLMSAEYILAQGNENVILCERGIRTFEPYTRNTLDLSAIPAVKRLSHLPVLVDPSHATGRAWMVEPMAMAALAAGADGLIIEVHNDPEHALCDGAQALTCAQLQRLSAVLEGMRS